MVLKQFLGCVLALLLGQAAFAASLMSHFQGRYGAIELFDSGKKLSFRVNAPELSLKRNFCQVEDLSIAIAAIEYGVVPDFDSPIAALAAKTAPGPELTMRQALRQGNRSYFASVSTLVGPQAIATMRARKLVPISGMTSAFALLDWMKAFERGALVYKSNTRKAVTTFLSQKRQDGRVIYAFSSRCPDGEGALASSVGYVASKSPPIYFVLSVEGKSRQDLFMVAPKIRDAALIEMGYWFAEPVDASGTPGELP